MGFIACAYPSVFGKYQGVVSECRAASIFDLDTVNAGRLRTCIGNLSWYIQDLDTAKSIPYKTTRLFIPPVVAVPSPSPPTSS